MKHALKSLFLLSLTTLCLTSCLPGSKSFVEFDSYIDPINTKYDFKGQGYYKNKEYKPLSYYDISDLTLQSKKQINDFSQIYSSTNNGRTYKNLASLGEQNILVLPISFKDSKKSDQNYKKIMIQNSFFGKDDVTICESVASYYNKVSYGQLKIKGEVADFYDVDYNYLDLNNTTFGSKENASKLFTFLALQEYKKTHSDLSKFDNDHDGYLDGVFTIYDAPYVDRDNLYWAYVDHLKKDEKITNYGQINKDEPYICTYGWASYNFLNVKYDTPDPHVFIHEVGHFFGLQDYYSERDYQPLGFMDMMDYNLGDHNAFSKMLLNWTTPYVVDGNATIKLHPSFNSGECIIIPNGEWNATPYDEFILLEFYAPEGVNRADTKLSFNYVDANNNTRTGQLFSNFGIKVYHVDSRLGYFENKATYNSMFALFDEKDSLEKIKAYQSKCMNHDDPNYNGYDYVKYCIDFAFSNSIDNHPYIKMIEADEKNTFKNKIAANNGSLFEKGDDMGITKFKNYTFYDGTPLPYHFKIKSINPEEAVIEFIKNN